MKDSMRSTPLLLAAVAILAAAPLEAQQTPSLAAPTAARAPRQSWTSDRRDFAVGAIITVLVDEYTLASAKKDNFASNRRLRDLGVGASQSVVSSIPALGADVSSINDAESRQRGDAFRQNRFQGEMSVRVTGIEPSGLLRVEGKKVVNVDDHREELSLMGYIRPEDVSAGNLVDSWRVGDAELVYTSDGSLGEPRSGMIGRLLGKIWP